MNAAGTAKSHGNPRSHKDPETLVLRHVLQRVEPWLIFLSILAILFLPYPKGIWWLVLLGLAIVNTWRRWNEAWTWFSLESIGEMLRAALWVPGIVLLYFALHAYLPQFVHASPSTEQLDGRHKMVVDIKLSDGTQYSRAWLLLRVQRKRGRIDLFGQVLPEDTSARALFDFEAVASYADYIRASLDGFHTRIGFRVLRGHIPWTQPDRILRGQGSIGFNKRGKPLHLSLQTDRGLSLED